MILVSVGTQLPFDRLIAAVDAWATHRDRHDVIAQIGPSEFSAQTITCFDFVEHAKFRELQARSDVMVTHAGMGSIITALEFGKPIIILARDHLRNEHRNGHQIATLKKFSRLPGVYTARDEAELAALLDRADELEARPYLGPKAPEEFTRAVAAHLANPHKRGWLAALARRLLLGRPAR